MDFNYTRRNSLFNNPVQPGISPVQITPEMMQGGTPAPMIQRPARPQQTMDDVYSKMMNEPSGPANQGYKDFLQAPPPSRDDYKPGKLNRLSAVLAGISTGAKGGDGYRAAQSILDDPYNEAMGDYKNRHDRLATGAGLEDKEVNNKVKTYRDFVTDEYNQRRADAEDNRNNRLDKATTADIEYKQKRAGTFETAEQKKQRILEQDKERNKNIFDRSRDLFNLEQPVRTQDAIKVAGVRGAEARATQKAKFNSLQELLKFKDGLPQRFVSKTDDDGQIIFFNPKDPSEVYETGYNSGKMSDADKIAAGLKAKVALKTTAGPTTKTENTTTVKGNTRTSTTTKTATTDKVDVIGPNGEVGKMDPSEIDSPQAKTAGWKRK